MKRNLLLVLLTIILSTATAWAQKSKNYSDSEPFRNGVIALESGLRQQAYELFCKELQIHPENGYAYLFKAQILAGEEGYEEEAFYSAQNAIRYIPKKETPLQGMAHVLLARLYEGMNDPENADKTYKKAEAALPNNYTLCFNRGMFLTRNGKYSEADACYRKLVKLNAIDPRAYTGLGWNAVETGDTTKALGYLDKAIALDSTNFDAHAMRADIFFKKGCHEEATSDALACVLEDNSDEMENILEQIAYTDLDLVTTRIKSKCGAEPDNVEWQKLLGKTYMDNSKYVEAIHIFRRITEKDAQDFHALSCLAMCYDGLCLYEEERHCFERMVEMIPEMGEYVGGGIAASSFYAGHHDEALEKITEYIKEYPENAEYYTIRGLFYYMLRNYDEAVRDLSTAIVLGGEVNAADPLLQRAHIYARMGRDALARADFGKIVETDSVPKPHSSVPYALIGLGQTDKAMAWLEQAIPLIKLAADYYSVACVYANAGFTDKALEFLRLSLERGYCSLDHISYDPDMDSLRDLPAFKALIDEFKPQLAEKQRQALAR